MGIDLGSAHIAVPQQFLEGENIYVPGLIHQGGGGVTQFMGGKPFQAGGLHGAGDELLHPPVGDPVFAPSGDKDRRLFGRQTFDAAPLLQVEVQRLHTGVVQIDHPLFVALAKQPDLPSGKVDVLHIHAHQLRQAHPAVQKQHGHAVIALGKIAGSPGGLQQGPGLVGGQILGQDLVQLGRADRRSWVLFQAACVVDHVVVKSVKAGQPPGGG